MIEEKPKNPRALRTFHNRQPKEYENIKRAMFIKGSKSSQIVTDTMKELASLKKPDVVKYNNKKKNKYPSPFESETTFEFLSNKSDCSLFMFGSHSKKRPHNLVMGRLFNHHILDMIELGVENFKPMVDFRAQKNAIGSKPCFIISGSHFENNEVMKMTANMFVDFFRGKVVDAINLTGIDHVIALTAKNEKSFHFRHYAIEFKKSGDRVPNVELVEIGPSIDFNIRRNQFAEGDVRKQTNPPKIKKKKNVKTNELKESISNVHIPSQKIEDVNKTVFRTKALKRKRIGENNNLEGVDTEYDEGSDEIPEDMEVETTPAPPSKKRKRNSDV